MTKTANRYKCDRCNREFPKKYNLDRHKQKSSCSRGQHKIDDLKAQPIIDQTLDESIFKVDIKRDDGTEQQLSNKLNEQLEQSNTRLRIINDSILRTEQDIKDTICDKYILSKLRDAVLNDIIEEIKRSSKYTENKEAIDDCFKIFEPRSNISYTIDSVLLSIVENRVDLLKTRTDNLNRLKKDKLNTLTEISGLTNKIVELLK
jgi:hypothetical protein